MSSKDKAPQQQTVDLSTLSVDNLAAVKKQLDDELEHLTTSFAKLRQAQNKFKECITTVKTGLRPGKTILVPLTTSLYVPGTLSDTENVLVDVGTGYYVEKSAADAENFYAGKVKTLTENLGELEKIVAQKSQNVQIVESGRSFPHPPEEGAMC
ncbi:Prefoldin alpha subunit [Choiromyces venosus 120613-1]|uniref:Prefoldin alpha subunit n=1 Tax=Choiromyces venosus 120613-1 TaxID=1336337 RepID=A0A3N4JN30_9PEZI|nr:Prefoldin alpha subunit [Choiromyces venosus 120613-1]